MKLYKNEFYCVATQDKLKLEDEDIKVKTLKNGTISLVGRYGKRKEKKIYRFISPADEEYYLDIYGYRYSK